MSERNELFDLAIARALEYAQRLKLNLNNPDELQKGLERWYLKTRFAYRISLLDIIQVLQICPSHSAIWQGGKDGQWIGQDK
jgi:hypothetical protein